MRPSAGYPGKMTSKSLPQPTYSEYQLNFLRKNPSTRGAVGRLLKLQARYHALNQQYQDNIWTVEQYHYGRCQAIFRDRQAIINETIIGYRQNSRTTSSGSAAGLSRFWLRALKRHPTVSQWVQASDELALSYLCEVRIEFVNSTDSKSFRILFDFTENPFFHNPTLTKQFIYKNDSSKDNIYGGLLYSKAPGCDINWKPGQDLTNASSRSSPFQRTLLF